MAKIDKLKNIYAKVVLKSELVKRGVPVSEADKMAESYRQFLSNPKDPVYKMTAETGYSCGAAAARIALKIIGIDTDESELRSKLNTNDTTGTEIKDFKPVFDEMKLNTVTQDNASMYDLIQAYDNGYTLICRYYMPDYGVDHYTVIKRIDNKKVYFSDPFYGKAEMSYKEFYNKWKIDAGLGNKPCWYIGIKKPVEMKQQEDNTRKTDKGLQKSIDEVLSKVNIDKKYDIPFIAGYSTDGKTIYIDNIIPDVVNINGLNIDTTPFLAIHEITEKSLMDALELNYIDAHQLALRVESAYINSYGIDWNEYDKVFDDLKKQIDKKEIKNVPADLDLAPYEYEAGIYPEDKKVLENLKQVMGA